MRERERDHREATARLDLLLQRSHQKFEFGGMEINKHHLLSNSADKWSIEQEIWSPQINDPYRVLTHLKQASHNKDQPDVHASTW